MRRFSRYLPALLMMQFIGMSGAYAASSWSLSADEWAAPRSGSAVVQFESLQAMMQLWLEQPGQKIVLQYPGEESGLLWALELRDWLVALGLPSSAITPQAGSGQAETLEIKLQPSEVIKP